MVETIVKSECKNRKKFLNSQVYDVSERIWDAISRFDDKKKNILENEKEEIEEEKKNNTEKKKTNTIDENKKTQMTERDIIENILREKSDFLAQRAIVWDIIYPGKDWWVELRCKYGLCITVLNLNSFIEFCTIHGFIPIIDEIYIGWQNVTKIKQLYTFFLHAIQHAKDVLIRQTLHNEINKLDKIFQWPAKSVLDYIVGITVYNSEIYQHLLWEKLQKITNKWALSENIFEEVAIRLENQVREKVWINSSYIILAWYKDDKDNKTDMKYIINKTKNQAYQVIPLQFTTSWPLWVIKNKEKSIESYIFKLLNKNIEVWSFIILAVNGDFSKHIAHWDNLNSDGERRNENIILNKEYSDWIENCGEREKKVVKRFPLFLDTIDPKFIKSAEIMYIALNMLYKKYNFRYSTKKSYLDSFKKSGKIDRTNQAIIYEGEEKDTEKEIKLSEIKIEWFSKKDKELKIDGCSIKEVKNPRPNFPSLLKHRFLISYQWEHMWTIVVYEPEQNPQQKTKKK